jgi:tetratricopeptide (TPR) repeat protein
MSATKKQVLVIEQNASLKTYYTKAFPKLGLEPKLVNNGQEALKFLRGSIDGSLFLVVMDWHVVDVPGYLIAQKVRSDQRLAGVDFLICASELKTEDTLLMSELDVVHTLQKGASTQQIVDKVKAILNEAGRAPRGVKLRKEFEVVLRNGNLQEATALLAEPELKKEVSGNPRHAHLLGEFEILRKKYDEAMGALRRHVDAFEGAVDSGAPLDASLGNPLRGVNAYAKALCLKGEFAEAEKLFAKLQSRSPKNLAHLVSQADALIGQDKLDEAKIKYAHALAQDATHRDALMGMGKVAVVEGRIEQAQEFFQQVEGGVESPSFASFFNNRAVALIHAGKVDEAVSLYENALKFIKRDRFPVMFNLGMAYLRLGQADKAAGIFQQVLDTCRTDFVAKKSVLQQFKLLGKEKFIEAYARGAVAASASDKPEGNPSAS